jgi:hypothetical protein
MPLYLEVLLWLIFASLGFAIVGFGVLLVWHTGRSVWRSRHLLRGGRNDVRALPTSGTITVRSDLTAPGLIWISLFALVPLLILAFWAAMVEIATGRVGVGLVLAIAHPLLLWQLIHLGTRVQRKVDLSPTLLVAHPVLGRRREVQWSAVTRVEDVTYIGPGVSGLYLYEVHGPPVVLDNWLPNKGLIRIAVRRFTQYANWIERSRGFFVG